MTLRGGLAAAVLLLCSCSVPLQNGEIEVRTGAAERLGVLCKWRHAGEDMCAASEEASADEVSADELPSPDTAPPSQPTNAEPAPSWLDQRPLARNHVPPLP